MILRRVARPQAISKGFDQLIRPSASITIQQQCRSLHGVPPLGGSQNQRGVYFHEHGVPGFLSPKTFRQTWELYQQRLVSEINAKTEDSEWANKPAYQMHVELSRRPDYADFYNITAMAHFNHLWWESLSDVKVPIPDLMEKEIIDNFGSVDTLRTEMLECADAMFGNGFVWLMKEIGAGPAGTQMKKLRILCTYNAGSPYSAAWRMRQGQESSTLLSSDRMTRPQNSVGVERFGGNLNEDRTRPPNALVAYPILCVNVWQHMWIPDYGIMNKRTYLAAWWERIDWTKVYERANTLPRSAFV